MMKKTKNKPAHVLNTHFKRFHFPSFAFLNGYVTQSLNDLFKRIYVLMTNKQQSSQHKYLAMNYLRKYIKLLVLLLTFLIFKISFSE